MNKMKIRPPRDDSEIKIVTIEWKNGTKEIFNGPAAKLCGMYGISLDSENCLAHRNCKPTKVIKRKKSR